MDRLTTTTYGSSFVALLGGMTTNDFAMISGVVIGVATLGMNFYFKREHLRLERRNLNRDKKGAN